MFVRWEQISKYCGKVTSLLCLLSRHFRFISNEGDINFPSENCSYPPSVYSRWCTPSLSSRHCLRSSGSWHLGSFPLFCLCGRYSCWGHIFSQSLCCRGQWQLEYGAHLCRWGSRLALRIPIFLGMLTEVVSTVKVETLLSQSCKMRNQLCYEL